jgi:dihydroorotate dehydrogenase (NAD+) catalytic subunit
VSKRVSIPVIGMGGIATGKDARDFLDVGATAIAVGTESFRDPAAGNRIRGELAALSPPSAPAAAEPVHT